MTARALSKKLGCSVSWIYRLKQRYPAECPKGFSDWRAWQKFYESIRQRVVIR